MTRWFDRAGDRSRWRDYRHDRVALEGIYFGHQAEIERAREFIAWANAECIAINNHLGGYDE